MFLVAIARPQSDNSRIVIFFDAMIGYWPLAEKMAAILSSLNCPTETLETKSFFVAKETNKNLFLNFVISSVR